MNSNSIWLPYEIPATQLNGRTESVHISIGSSNFNEIHVIFIPGNPGLVAYYREFLSILYTVTNSSLNSTPESAVLETPVPVKDPEYGNYSLLEPSKPTRAFYDPEADFASASRVATEEFKALHAEKQQESPTRISIFGRSLAGFELPSKSSAGSRQVQATLTISSDLERHIDSQLHSRYPPGKPLSLQDQVLATELILQTYLSYLSAHSNTSADIPDKHPTSTSRRPKLILIGHSVGAYIALELIKQHHRQNNTFSPVLPHIIGAILLFPTITHIARSPRGRSLAPLLSLPIEKLNAHVDTVSFLATLLHSLVLLLRIVLVLFGATLESAIARVKDMTPEAATATAGFLRSRAAVRQCLFMGRFELREITEDRWGEEVWGALHAVDRDGAMMNGTGAVNGEVGGKGKMSAQERPPPKLVLHFGREDHWVAEKEREELISRRGDGVIEEVASEEVERVQANGDAGGIERLEGREVNARPKFVLDKAGIPHGFSIRHSEHVARKCAAYIEEIVALDVTRMESRK